MAGCHSLDIDRVSLNYTSLITPTMPHSDANTRHTSSWIDNMISETSDIMIQGWCMVCCDATMSRESSHDHVGSPVPGGDLCTVGPEHTGPHWHCGHCGTVS